MITISTSLLFFAFYTLYYTSKRVPLSYNLGFEKWMQNKPNPTKTIGLFLLLLAYFSWIYATALGAGTLLFFIELMAIGSFTVILKPLKVIPPETVIAVLVIMGIIEIYYSLLF
jgi:hypothetical protein